MRFEALGLIMLWQVKGSTVCTCKKCCSPMYAEAILKRVPMYYMSIDFLQAHLTRAQAVVVITR